jgi:hypothetical protein
MHVRLAGSAFQPFEQLSVASHDSHSTLMASSTTGVVVDVEDKELKPWKYEGYPGFGKWMASSDDFFVLRRFGQLNVRVLLLMQDRIQRKEEQLFSIDERAQNGPDIAGVANSLRSDPQGEREPLLDEIKVLLKEYSRSVKLLKT